MLLDMLERSGRGDEVLTLLREQLWATQARGDQAEIARSALVLARRVHPRDPYDALDIVRTALTHAPDHRELLYAARDWIAEDEFADRAAVIERLVEIEPVEVASGLARELAAGHAARGDEDAELRVLVRAYRRAPADAETRGALERAYEARGDYRGLAELLRAAADAHTDPEVRVPTLRQAATIHRELLGDPDGAIALLEQAHALRPNDAEIGVDLATSLAAAGAADRAMAVLDTLLDGDIDDALRLQVLTSRAQMRIDRGAHDAAIADLEGAFVLDANTVAPALILGLQRQRDAARDAGNAEIERAATLRLVEILTTQDRREEARTALGEWIERDRKDSAALGLMVELDTLDERWDAVAKSCGRLVAIEQGEAQSTAALRLADACRALGKPEDARAGLEHARRKQPNNVAIRDALRGIYELIGAEKELARLLFSEAEETEDEGKRVDLLRRASVLLFDQGEVEQAVPVVRALLELRPDDFGSALLLIDAYLSLDETDQASGVLEATLGDGKGKKATELAALHHRRARIAGARGNHDEQIAELQVAFGHDKNSGDIAAELADLAEALEQWDLAVRVLRTITLIDGECPISRTSAFLRQAKIAHRRGDRQRAVLWARKAKHEAPDSADVTDFLTELGEA
jgi:tetratricopeptide (TPR) repeat protein